MSIKVIGAIMGGMIVQFRTKFKMLPGIFNHGIINGKKKGLFFQRTGNCPDCFGYSNIIPNRVIIGIGFQCIVKGIKRSIGQPGDHMAVSKTNRAENVQSQNGDDQQEQISGGGSGSRVKIIVKI